MKIRFNRTGAQRKALVTAIGEVLEVKPKYMGAPGFAYSVGAYMVDKDGTLESGVGTESELASLLSALAAQGFVAEDAPNPDACTEDILSIELPAEGLQGAAFENLKRLIAGKAPLIRAALGKNLAVSADALPVHCSDGKVCFPWFQPGMAPDMTDAWSRFVAALCETAKRQRRVIMSEKPYDGSEKYAMRCFLLKLGFIGEEYKAARQTILSNLSGNGSFKRAEGKPPKDATDAAAHGDCLSCGRSMSEPGEAESGQDRLFCTERQAYVNEDGVCPAYN